MNAPLVLPQVHRIETLRLELDHRNEREARRGFELHDRLMVFLRHEGLAAIEAAFDGVCPPGQVWVLPRLTLDLGVVEARQDERLWLDRLTRTLRRELERATPTMETGTTTTSGSPVRPLPIEHRDGERHEVDQFLHYLRHGQLPWGVNLGGRRALSLWLARLAQRQGAALWRALSQDRARDRLLARLSRIAPHDGLQALIAQRDPRLATTLTRLDDEVLIPLQGRGRLSAYQRGQLQQALRVAALEGLWAARGTASTGSAGLGGRGRRSLIARWRRLLADALGGRWREDLAALAGATRSPGDERFPMDLADELPGASPGTSPGTSTGTSPDTASASPGRTWEQALIQLQALLRERRPGQGERLRHLLTQLAASHPMLLRHRLRAWAMQRRERRTWSLTLPPASLALLLGAMSPRPLPALAGSAGQHWAESLRQTALRLEREAPAGQRLGVSRLMALLMQASLRHFAEGRRAPDQHAGWLALWRRASVDARRWEATPAASAAASRAKAAAEDNPPPPRPRRREAGDATGDALLHLERECREGRWRWPQRLRLARLLETAQGCERWLQLLTEDRRWSMLQAQFGAITGPLRQRAGRLQGWLRGLVREPAAALAEHWRRLCRHLFIRGLSPDAASLRRHYLEDALPDDEPDDAGEVDEMDEPDQRDEAGHRLAASAVARLDPSARPDRPDRPDRTDRPARPVRSDGRPEPVWVDDAGQVLLAAYAERLFKHLQLVRDGQFIDDAARATAVQCLQTLCHGREPAPPDDSCTVLSRLLCGVAADTVLPAPAPFDEERHTLLDQLLGAVIAHWSALGRTSVAGLRESFLQRQGRLQQERVPAGEPPRWRMRVQPRGFDVLLDRMPWSFHTIRLPWMQGALHVDWR